MSLFSRHVKELTNSMKRVVYFGLIDVLAITALVQVADNNRCVKINYFVSFIHKHT